MEQPGCKNPHLELPQPYANNTYFTIELLSIEKVMLNLGIINVADGQATQVIIPNGKEVEAILSTYANFPHGKDMSLPSSGGLQLGAGPISIVFNIERDDTSLAITFTHNNQTMHCGVRLNLENLEFGLTFGNTVQTTDITNFADLGFARTETETYTHINISGGLLLALFTAALGYSMAPGHGGYAIN